MSIAARIVFATCAGLSLLVAGSGGACAQLVLDGETIGDAKLVEAARREGHVILFTSYPVEAMKPVIEAFQTDSGIEVQMTRLPSSELFQRITTEFSAGRLDADVIDTTDVGWNQQLVERGILIEHQVPSFAQIPADIRDLRGRWYSVARPVSVVGVNLSRVAEADVPKSWKDLLDPKWTGAIGLVSVDAGGSTWSLYSYLRTVIDPDYWTKLSALKPKVYPAFAPTVFDLVRGEVALAVAPLVEPVQVHAKAGAPLRVVFPSEGISAFPIASGITSTAKNPNAAALLMNWFTSRHGGNVVARGGAYAANMTADRPSVGGLVYPDVDKVWNLKADGWTVGREQGVSEWRRIFQTK